MDGSENKTTIQRCKVFDLLFVAGALHLDDLAERLELQRRTVEKLIEHEWFTTPKQGVVNVQYTKGTGRRLSAHAA